MGVNHGGNRLIVHMPMTGDERFDTSDSLLFGLMGKHGASDDIADGINSLGSGGKTLVDGNIAFVVELDANAVQAKALCIRDPAHR